MNIKAKISILATFAAVAVFSGCAAAAGGGSSMGTDRNVITAEELATLNVSTLYETVQRLRPQWLRVRGGQSLSTLTTDIVVFQNNTMLGGTDVLRRLGHDSAAWLEYMPGSKASNVLAGLGSRHVEGAIIVHTTPREPGN
ncbi:MAG TPA: hypothetical protein VFI91_11755 [Longimicrobiaceae bacterium]|nr:hypothetical protein [Longimicrobiaceae bacterium]